MRKHHNKLYYGQYPCKVEFSFPGWATTLWPTTDHNLRDVSNNNANANMLIDLANFIDWHLHYYFKFFVQNALKCRSFVAKCIKMWIFS